MGNNWCCGCKHSNPEKKIVLLLIGLDGAGKTTTVKGLAGEIRHNVVPTVGFSVEHLKYRGNNVDIYDVGGGSQIRGIWHLYFADAHGIIFVVDSNDYRRLTETRTILHELLMNPKLAGKPMLLLANKQDLIGSLDELDIVEKLHLEDLVNQQRCPTLVKACSSLEDSNTTKLDDAIFKGYLWLLNLILRDYWKLNARVERDQKEQEAKYIQNRKSLLERIQQKPERRSTANSIEWINGSGDRPSPIDVMNSDEDSTSSPIIFDTPNKSPIITIHSQNVPLKRRFLDRRSNKTAPATLLGTSSIVHISPTVSRRKLKSALPRMPLTLDAGKLEESINKVFKASLEAERIPLSVFTKPTTSNGTVQKIQDTDALEVIM